MSRKKYRDELVQLIKDSGQELIDRAESMVAEDLDLISGLTIQIDLSCEVIRNRIPEIKYTTGLLNKNTHDRLRNERRG